MKRDYGVFQVGLKVLLRKGSKVLLLRNDKGLVDLPGGRIDNVEYRTPLEKIIAREVREELGPKVKYALGEPIFHFRRRRPGSTHPAFVFLAVYDARWVAGGIELSSEHFSYEWIDPKKYILKRSDFGQDEEYRAFKNYFAAKEKKC